MFEQIEEIIKDSMRRLCERPEFVSWRTEEAPGTGDILLINNSFVFRDVRTNKAAEYLCLLVEDPPTESAIGVTVGLTINLDFKRVDAASTNPPQLTPLQAAIEPQINELGHLVFLLIGEVQDTEVIEAGLNHVAFDGVVWNPAGIEDVQLDQTKIVVKQTADETTIWTALVDQLASAAIDPSEALRAALGVALDKLQDQAIAKVVLPAPGQEPTFGITDAILAVLREQRDQYADAVLRSAAPGPDALSAINDVLRIAYNFASDATGFLRLIVSVCDLKPIVLWGTIAEHFALSTAFHALPWSRSKSKPSLKNYQQTIADARNSAFHNLFPFRKSLRILLPETALGAPELQIFSEHTKKSENQLVYRDKELIEVLTEFTRARERSLPLSFWQKNLDVMNATIALFEQTNTFVKALARTRAA